MIPPSSVYPSPARVSPLWQRLPIVALAASPMGVLSAASPASFRAWHAGPAGPLFPFLPAFSRRVPDPPAAGKGGGGGHGKSKGQDQDQGQAPGRPQDQGTVDKDIAGSHGGGGHGGRTGREAEATAQVAEERAAREQFAAYERERQALAEDVYERYRRQFRGR